MAAVPKRVAERLASGLKRYQPILDGAKARDVNESDTSMIVSDMLADVFGYDKYNEITRELCIRGTYCDLAIRLDQKFQVLIEVKAVGGELKEQHVKQAVDYAANHGTEWVVLTNGIHWQVFRVSFGKPIDKELVVDLHVPVLSGRNEDDVAKLFLLSRESMVKSALEEYHDQKQATNKFVLAAAILSDPVLEVVRRQLRRMSPDLRVETDDLRTAISQDVLKREVIEGEPADQARKKLSRAANRLLRILKSDDEGDDAGTKTPSVSTETSTSPAVE